MSKRASFFLVSALLALAACAAPQSDGFEGATEQASEATAGASFVVKQGLAAGTRFTLTKATTTIGRESGSDIVLDEVTVSPKHAEVRRRSDGKYEIVDLDSVNGTYVNKQPIEQAVLASGDVVQLGKVRLEFMTASAPTPEPTE